MKKHLAAGCRAGTYITQLYSSLSSPPALQSICSHSLFSITSCLQPPAGVAFSVCLVSQWTSCSCSWVEEFGNLLLTSSAAAAATITSSQCLGAVVTKQGGGEELWQRTLHKVVTFIACKTHSLGAGGAWGFYAGFMFWEL